MMSGNAEQRRARLKAVLQIAPDDPACQACLEDLTDYVDAQLAGRDYTGLYPDVATHLDACPECAAAYARLYQLGLAEAADQLPHPERIPTPDFSFLLPGSRGPLPPAEARARLGAAALVDRLRSAIQRVGDRLSLQFTPDLLSALRPAEGTAAVRAPPEGERYGEKLLSLTPGEGLEGELPINVQVYRDARQPQLCLVEVAVEQAGRSWPDLGGVRVELLAGAERRRAVTDAWGLASFPDIPIADLEGLRLEIELP